MNDKITTKKINFDQLYKLAAEKFPSPKRVMGTMLIDNLDRLRLEIIAEAHPHTLGGFNHLKDCLGRCSEKEITDAIDDYRNLLLNFEPEVKQLNELYFSFKKGEIKNDQNEKISKKYFEETYAHPVKNKFRHVLYDFGMVRDNICLRREIVMLEELSSLSNIAFYNLMCPKPKCGYQIVKYIFNDALSLSVAAGYRPYGITGNCAIPNYKNFDALLEKGADVTATDEMDDSALEIILTIGNIKEHMPLVDRLITAGADISLERFYNMANREYIRRRDAILGGKIRENYAPSEEIGKIGENYKPSEYLVNISRQFELHSEDYTTIGSKFIRAFCEKYGDKIIQ